MRLTGRPYVLSVHGPLLARRAWLEAEMKLRLAGMEVDFTGSGNTGSRFIEMVRVTKEGRFLR